jgi:hypothetical protein
MIDDSRDLYLWFRQVNEMRSKWDSLLGSVREK